MARPPLALGHHGTIKVTRDGDRWVARCRFRDLDGVTRPVERRGTSKVKARQALQDELQGRRGERTEMLRPNSRFREAPRSGWPRSGSGGRTRPPTPTPAA